jgi:processive rubber oxygenase RoxA-like protein
MSYLASVALCFFLFLLGAAVHAAGAGQPPNACDAIDLDQGWTRGQSEAFWFTTQGSRLMPYAWFRELEVADPSSVTLFRDASNLDRYGYLGMAPSEHNMDGLPIGFAKDVGNAGDEHLGFTCAACHTGGLEIAGKRVIVEGGQGLGDFWLFLADVAGALATARNDPAKFDRFSKRVLKTGSPSDGDLKALRNRMEEKLADLQTRIKQNAPANPSGRGRVDAFGHIFSRVLAQTFEIPANAEPPFAPSVSAPVSYPFLWDTPHLDVVQWNGSAPNSRFLSLGPLGRNIGEVLGVFADMKIVPGRKVPFFPSLSKPPQLVSSANLTNLIALEELVKRLWSPQWPKNCLPLADAATLARGRAVYEGDGGCVSCHRLLGPAERKDPRRNITAVLETLPAVATDPTMAMNFAARSAKSGAWAGHPNVVTLARDGRLSTFGSEADGRDLLLAAVNDVILRGGVPVEPSGLFINPIEDLRRMKKALEASQTPVYKARPLNGIWATAPYLHNGSVPTLYDLLLPENERPPVFFIASRELDPKKVGLVTTEAPGAFRFDTSPQGNWRNGHTFGTNLTKKQKEDLLEFLKTL